jgi:transcription termination/antitermination protein NusG
VVSGGIRSLEPERKDLFAMSDQPIKTEDQPPTDGSLPQSLPEVKGAGPKEPSPEVAAPEPASADGAVSNGAASGPNNKRWYVVKVQSGREESIKDAIERRVKIEGLEEYFGQIIIPVEHVTEMRNNKRVTRERKLYPGYLMVEVEYNDRILYLFRETSGVGDFVGGSIHHPPPPMSEREIERMLHQRAKPGEAVAVKQGKCPFERGDRVKVREGTFAGMEGEVKEILEAKGLVRVEITIFGRPVPVELEYWQVDHA